MEYNSPSSYFDKRQIGSTRAHTLRDTIVLCVVNLV